MGDWAKALVQRRRFLVDSVATGVVPPWRWLGWLEEHVARALLVKAVISAGAGWLASLAGRQGDTLMQWLIGTAVFLIVFLLLVLNGAFVQAQKASDPRVYAKGLVLERETPISGDDFIGVELEFTNRTGYPLSLHVQRDRVLYNGTLAPVRVTTARNIPNNERGTVRVALPINRDASPDTPLHQIVLDRDAGNVKGIDVEDLDIMARLSEKSRIVADVTVPMPERQAYTLTLRNGVWALGRQQFASGISV